MKPLLYPTARWAKEAPDQAALITTARVVSYAELESEIVRVVRVLYDLGVGPGDRVIICAANSPEWVIASHAVARIGAVLVPITVRLTNSEAAQHRIVLQPALILADAERLSLWQHAGHQSVSLIMLDEFSQRFRGVSDGTTSVSDQVDPEVLHTIVSTSGTSGAPRGVCLSLRNHLANALASAVNLGVLPEDRWLLNLPLYHVGGLAIALRAAFYGTAVVVAESTDSEETMRCIRDHRVTQLSLVATTLRRLLHLPIARFPEHVRTVLVGGGPVPDDLIREGCARGLPILPTYGMTETGSQAATATHTDVAAGLFSARPLCVVEIEIRDDTGNALPTATEGRIFLRGPIVAMGYLQGPGQITPLSDDAGWFAATDVGSVDEEGRLTVHGRIDSVIISGGEKIHAEEIEAALLQIDGVANASVIPIEDQTWGQRPLAFVEPVPGAAIDPAHIASALSQRLARHKNPARIVIVPRLPLLPSGKIDRQALTVREFLTQTRPPSP